MVFVIAVYWYGYESLKVKLMDIMHNHDTGPTLTQCFISGACSGTVKMQLFFFLVEIGYFAHAQVFSPFLLSRHM